MEFEKVCAEIVQKRNCKKQAHFREIEGRYLCTFHFNRLMAKKSKDSFSVAETPSKTEIKSTAETGVSKPVLTSQIKVHVVNEECAIIVKSTNKHCRRKATFRDILQRSLCCSHFKRWSDEANRKIQPRYRGLTLSSNTVSNYMFFMFLYRHLKQKHKALSKYIWLEILSLSQKISVGDKVLHIDTGKTLMVVDIRGDELLSFYNHGVNLWLVEEKGGASFCFDLYKQQKREQGGFIQSANQPDKLIDVYRFSWVDELNLYVPWNDKEPLLTKYYSLSTRVYAGHRDNKDLAIKNSRYNGKKYKDIPTIPPRYLDFTC